MGFLFNKNFWKVGAFGLLMFSLGVLITAVSVIFAAEGLSNTLLGFAIGVLTAIGIYEAGDVARGFLHRTRE